MPQEWANALIAGGIFFGYIVLNFYVGAKICNWIAGWFAKEDDDEILQYDVEKGMGRETWTPVSRADMRSRYWRFLLVYPLLGFLNYKYWDSIWGTMEKVATAGVKLVDRIFY